MFMYIWTGVMSICVFFSSGAGPRWQFQDIDGLWKDYSKGSSVSSQDIELQYQQNPSGTVKFTTNSYGYELDLSGELQHLQTDGSICRSSPDLLKVFSFAAMSQKNMSTSTTRSVRRLQQWQTTDGSKVGGQHNVDPHDGLRARLRTSLKLERFSSVFHKLPHLVAFWETNMRHLKILLIYMYLMDLTS